MSDVVAILLSAGESRRMGQLKALLPWQGASLLEHQVGALKAGGANRVIVVVGHQAERLRPLVAEIADVTCVLNPDYLTGKTTSIKAGINGLAVNKPQTLLMLNVDQPRSAETIRLLLEAHQSAPVLLTIPTFQGKGGHPIIIDGSLIDEILAIEEDTQGMKAVMQRHSEQTQRVAVESPEVLWDLNTPEQYQAALES
ncbi:MAG: nucleotidyltransferase family protein [Chloroflexi bacterium]|nr:nucleotidyltransferase family protein [Chloroflexota bacterium]MDA1219392.1 nucleotidyltransferase family protein [Chloroflexota bacterium]